VASPGCGRRGVGKGEEMLKSISVSNFKCFKSTERIQLGRAWTVIVGQNNSGKSAFLKICDFTRATSSPYKGSAIEPDVPVNPTTVVEFEIEYSGPDLRRYLHQSRQTFYWGRLAPSSALATPGHQIETKFDKTLKDGNIVVQGTFALGTQLSNVRMKSEDGTQIFPSQFFSQINSVQPDNTFAFNHGNIGANDSHVAHLNILYTQSVYLFGAERLLVGQFAIGDTLDLQSNAANLAQVVHRLRQQPALFATYVSLVREVIPSITDIVPSVVAGTQNVEIKVSFHDPSLNREDLNFSLQECGTGVSQVLAILFVVVTSRYSKTIVIDEPNSFLHPGASKKLVQILKRYPLHQFVISTHSPELIEVANPDVVLQVTWQEAGSTVEQLDRKDLDQMRSALGDLGVSLADVFSSERIIWVEGPTEEICFKTLLRIANRSVPSGTAIIPLRTTGELNGKHKKAFYEIYSKASQSGSLLPVEYCFSVDSEGLDEIAKADLNRQSGGKFCFLPRRLFENYLLHPQAISTLLKDTGIPIEPQLVVNWLKEHGHRERYSTKDWDQNISNPEWLKKVHGASLLSDMFKSLTETKMEYRKVSHGAELFNWILANDPAHVEELCAYVYNLAS
jgi:energy-coupling factor transporter ATP-binding protein EcfA2